MPPTRRRFTAKLDLRVLPSTLSSLDSWADAAGVRPADAARFFLPSHGPDPVNHPEDEATLEALRAHREDQELVEGSRR